MLANTAMMMDRGVVGAGKRDETVDG